VLAYLSKFVFLFFFIYYCFPVKSTCGDHLLHLRRRYSFSCSLVVLILFLFLRLSLGSVAYKAFLIFVFFFFFFSSLSLHSLCAWLSAAGFFYLILLLLARLFFFYIALPLPFSFRDKSDIFVLLCSLYYLHPFLLNSKFIPLAVLQL
jgi:hypothetical protein